MYQETQVAISALTWSMNSLNRVEAYRPETFWTLAGDTEQNPSLMRGNVDGLRTTCCL